MPYNKSYFRCVSFVCHVCVILYPRLKVRWKLVRQLIHLLGIEIRSRLQPEQAAYFLAYLFTPSIGRQSILDAVVSRFSNRYDDN
ncbi:hypothetical protein [Nostoc sp. 'Peltigera membranacea cyanobiont' 210A]|uniref:hypothetical protein n=1 Tax=Nostoc sp. 'Peltigera membranacea cyanobiont' 210A TaxID=2014529 RepID=UPI00117D33D8|nr:hypothetical protein [Nostoc sp. 'Peltigera membranacea cyanobiont' 210A]